MCTAVCLQQALLLLHDESSPPRSPIACHRSRPTSLDSTRLDSTRLDSTRRDSHLSHCVQRKFPLAALHSSLPLGVAIDRAVSSRGRREKGQREKEGGLRDRDRIACSVRLLMRRRHWTTTGFGTGTVRRLDRPSPIRTRPCVLDQRSDDRDDRAAASLLPVATSIRVHCAVPTGAVWVDERFGRCVQPGR